MSLVSPRGLRHLALQALLDDGSFQLQQFNHQAREGDGLVRLRRREAELDRRGHGVFFVTNTLRTLLEYSNARRRPPGAARPI